jgi:hypothetical protein
MFQQDLILRQIQMLTVAITKAFGLAQHDAPGAIQELESTAVQLFGLDLGTLSLLPLELAMELLDGPDVAARWVMAAQLLQARAELTQDAAGAQRARDLIERALAHDPERATLALSGAPS